MNQLRYAFLAISCLIVASTAATAADDSKFDRKVHEQIVSKAVDYLRKSQGADGAFSPEAGGTGVTSLVTTGLLRTGRTADDPLVAKSLKYLEKFVRPDGGIYAENSKHQNYETCIAMQCFAEANKDKRYDKLLKDAERFVKNLQWDDGEMHDKASVNYGGAGYGNSKRPDLSNTSFLLDALKSVGNGPDDDAVKRALVFVSRCQNLETEYNTTPFAAKNPDGGFYYTPSAGGSSQAGTTPDGGLRSYASMTYAGLKSMIYAGVGPDDPRVKAAAGWLKHHYSVEENPGMGTNGLFYYYQTFAKALSAMNATQFEDADGKKHDWRDDLVKALAAKQSPEGAWVNENTRWLEGNPNLSTGYALLALSYCRK